MSKGEQGRCHHRFGHAPLIGKSKDGRFKTEKAKVYPVQFNKDLADAIMAFLKVAVGAPLYTQVPDFLRQRPWEDFVPAEIIQRDYHR